MAVGRALVAAVLAGAASLAASAYAASMEIGDRRLFATGPAATVPVPPEFLPAGVRAPAAQSPLTAGQHDALAAALWRNPLDQRLVNLLYVDAVRTGRDRTGKQASGRGAQTLGRLGWRYTQAQQNLMLRAALEERFPEVVDRADGLLRRQKMTDQAIAMLMAMEAIPQVHGLVVDKLLGDPLWRHDYLLRIAAQTPPQILDARIRTMRSLLSDPGDVSRAELAPTLQALIGSGRPRAAYDLWTQKAGPARANLVRDPAFRAATANAGDTTAIPFEWRFSQNLGYAASAGPDGATIIWDGRGVPVFMSQLVPVRPGRSYLLAITGRADSGRLADLIAPTLACGRASVAFAPIGTMTDNTRWRSGPVPPDCEMAELTIGGSVDTGAQATTMDIGRIVLQPAG